MLRHYTPRSDPSARILEHVYKKAMREIFRWGQRKPGWRALRGLAKFKPAPILPAGRPLWSAERKTLVQGVLYS